MEKEIRVLMILEVMGRPKEYIKEALEGIINRIKEEKDVKVRDKKIAEPKQIQNKDLFSTFSEVEIEVGNLLTLFRLIFTYLPSHVEIVEPEEFKLRNFDLNILCNELTKVIHKYDEIAKIVSWQKNILENKLKEATEGRQAEDRVKKKKKRKKSKS